MNGLVFKLTAVLLKFTIELNHNIIEGLIFLLLIYYFDSRPSLLPIVFFLKRFLSLFKFILKTVKLVDHKRWHRQMNNRYIWTSISIKDELMVLSVD